MSNKGHDNLIPQAHVLTVEEQSAGGRKSAEVRRKRRQAKDTLNALLALPVKAGSVTDPEDLKSIADKSNTDVNTRILVNLVKSAVDGDTKSIQLLYTLTGEYNTRMQINASTDDDTLRRAQEDLGRIFTRISQEEEPQKVDHSKLARMFEWWVYRDNLSEISMRFNDQQLQEIHMWFDTADNAEKINFTHKVLANDKLPTEESIMLFDQQYLPTVRRHFNKLNQPEPQTLAELFERRNTELTDSFTD